MFDNEVFKKVRKIQIRTSRLVNDALSGEYQSAFKGLGMEFDEVREYQPGDDVRTIDWNVTARTGRPHIKKFVEEREMTVMFMVDASDSKLFGTKQQFKNSTITNGGGGYNLADDYYTYRYRRPLYI